MCLCISMFCGDHWNMAAILFPVPFKYGRYTVSGSIQIWLPNTLWKFGTMVISSGDYLFTITCTSVWVPEYLYINIDVRARWPLDNVPSDETRWRKVSGADVPLLDDPGSEAASYVSFTGFNVLYCILAVKCLLINVLHYRNVPLTPGELYLSSFGSIWGDAIKVYMPQWILWNLFVCLGAHALKW